MSDPIDLHRSHRRKASLLDEQAERLPPSDDASERNILGCILYPSKEALSEAQSRLVTLDVWYDQRHRMIFEAICEMAEDNFPVDVSTITARLSAFGQLNAVGGATYISSLPDAASSGALSFYIKSVVDCYQLRRIIQVSTEAIQKAYEREDEPTELLDWFEKESLRVRLSEGQTAAANCADAVNHAIDVIENHHQRQGVINGLATGFVDLDKMTWGLHAGDLFIIAGRPSMGKSSLAMNIAEHLAVDQQTPVCCFSLEMAKTALILRTICSRSRVNLRNIREGFLAERDFPKITVAAGKLRKAPLCIDDSPGLTVSQIRARARRYQQQFGIKLFIVDHFQNIQLQVRRGENRQSAFADASTGLKLMARELNVPVIVLSQLSRDFERDKSRKPRLSDLKETGQLEQDADIAGLLYKPRGDEDEEEQDAIPVNLLVAKSRNGPTGIVHLTFLRSYTRFESASKISGDDVPEPAPMI